MLAYESKYRNIAVWSISFVFILLNAAVFYFLGVPYLVFVSFALLIGVMSLIAYDKLFFLVAFLAPLSLNLSYFVTTTPVDLSLFTEPILVLILMIVSLKFLINRNIEPKVLLHPISMALIFNLFWIFVTSLLSTMPLVSFKFWLARLWFVVPMFFFGLKIFKDYTKVKPFIWAYAIALFFVVIYATYNFSQTSLLKQNAAHFVVKPFYKDHTIYGAVTAFFAPVLWGFVFNKNYKPWQKLTSLFFAIVITTGVILSYSRAAWIGLVAALAVWIVVKLRIKFVFLLITGLILGAFVWAFWFQILDKLEKNRQDTSSHLTEQIASITNISTDASNKERLNRWYCAIEMFKEKPLTGWGPATYQFNYAPFQLKRMKTIISTDFGDVGNAHSEYLGPLAEQGILGLISVLWLFIAILMTGLRVYKQTEDMEIRNLVLSITLGFITYFIHGFMNNFLDTDKMTIPFFGFASILVAIDLYHEKTTDTVWFNSEPLSTPVPKKSE